MITAHVRITITVTITVITTITPARIMKRYSIPSAA